VKLSGQRHGVLVPGDAGAALPQALSRRTFLAGLSATALAIPLIAVRPEMAQARTPFRGVDVRPRADWAGGLTPTGPLRQERPGDTRFLLVHHTASANDYDPGDVPGLLRGFYRFHTGPDRRWPDVAYNFFVDRYGTVWEGRRARAKSSDKRLTCTDAGVERWDPVPTPGRRVKRPTAKSL
jgi:hypothetical protein